MLDVLRVRTDGVVRRREVALMECAHFVRLESTDDRVQHAAVVEEDEVVLVPVVGVYQLYAALVSIAQKTRLDFAELTLGAMAGRCILYKISLTVARSVMCAPSG